MLEVVPIVLRREGGAGQHIGPRGETVGRLWDGYVNNLRNAEKASYSRARERIGRK